LPSSGDFGNFEVEEKADRRGRNPQTGVEITIAARKILTFKASAILKDAINTANYQQGILRCAFARQCHVRGSLEAYTR